MKIFFLAVLLLISACTTKPHTVVYGSHWQQSWQNAVMDQCKQESQVIAFAIIEAKLSAGYDVTQEDVDVLEKMIYHSCLKYYGLFI
jgi:hypothetical protein